MTIAGEEWREMDAQSRVYDPAAQSDVVAAARQGIERHRKRDVQLRLLRPDGAPAAGARVRAVQLRNDFLVGDMLWELDTMRRFGEQDLDRAVAWRQRFAEVLNAANALCYWTERPRNDGAKCEDQQGVQRLEAFSWCVDWANAAGLAVKGHPLFWSIPKAVPDWVMRYDHATQLTFLEVRIRSIVSRFKGRVKLWDAINEPMWEPAFKNLAQREWPHLDAIPDIADYIAPVLRWGREEDPDATFVINDYGLELDPVNGAPKAKDGTAVTAKLQRARFLALMRELKQRGAAPDALGLQSHTGGWFGHREQIALYDEMATSGLPVHITEFWADTHHLEQAGLAKDRILELQAEYVANYVTCAYGHPAVGAFFFWGFMRAAVRWLDDRSGHELTPMFHRVKKLLKEEWLTTVDLTADADGVVRFRGFTGDYSLRFATGLGEQGVRFAVSAQDAMPKTVTIR